jgi:hypothetical protein
MSSGDLDTLTTLVTQERAKELRAPNGAEMVQMASALYPEAARINGVTVTGGSATMRLTAKVEQGTAQGTVKLVKENGVWKVGNEDWQINMSLTADASPPAPQLPPDAVRPGDYDTLLGKWHGGEAGADDWTFTFGSGYAVSSEHMSGAFYRGQAAIFYDLGARSGGVRVPPGWSVLDVQVSEASDSRHAGQVSLGTFSKSADTLKFCGSEPGTHVRTESFETPPRGVRCLTLIRVGEVASLGQ